MNPVAFLVFPINYLLGSLPCGFIVTWVLRGVDLRKYGSGNIGATNVSRVAGFFPALLAGVGDALKGFLGAYLAFRFFGTSPLFLLAAFLVVVGHDWSCFLKFKGGKGVATTLGVLFFLSWQVALLCFLTWVLVVVFTRYSSLGSLSGAAAMPGLLLLFHRPFVFVWWGILAALLVFIRHKDNLRRLLQGKELKIGEKGCGESERRGFGIE